MSAVRKAPAIGKTKLPDRIFAIGEQSFYEIDFDILTQKLGFECEISYFLDALIAACAAASLAMGTLNGEHDT